MLRLHGVVAAAALIATLLTALATGGCDTQHRKATPLSGFSAPFVFGHFQVPADNPLTKEAVGLGRRLFYDPRLSANRKVSCSTCHIISSAWPSPMAVSPASACPASRWRSTA
jgi:cytochrome c peroxidase